MLSFRRLTSDSSPAPTSLNGLVALLNDVWRAGHFYVASGLRLAWQFEAEQTLPWEIFRGRLLDVGQTRAERRFLTWNLIQVEGQALVSDPMLSVLVDPADLTLHVTRGVLCHVWRPAGSGNVVEAAEATRWVRELVGTVLLSDFPDGAELRDELMALVWHAIVGTSRLPLQSLEAPLPAYTLGQLAYVPRAEAGDQPLRHWPELFTQAWSADLSGRERVKLLETLLRTARAGDMADLAAILGDDTRLATLLRRLFNDVSLSPYTDFVAHALAFVRALSFQGHWTHADEADLLCHLVRLQNRHLNAYDLVTFHHRGANYPDALLLDAMLARLLELAEERPQLFETDKTRRQALLLACQLRHHYEGLAVPPQPTSPGENARVMPWPRVPEAEILETTKRSRTLFADRPLATLVTPATRTLLTAALADLAEDPPRRELGTALFIDRPLGYVKHPAQRDQTPLLAHECFSPSLLRRRLAHLGSMADALGLAPPNALADLALSGISIDTLAADPHPCASLADARKVASDFMLVRTLPLGLRALFACFTWEGEPPPQWLDPGVDRALVHLSADALHRLTLFEADGRRFDLTLDLSQGWRQRAGIEFPRAGIEVVREGYRSRLRG